MRRAHLRSRPSGLEHPADVVQGRERVKPKTFLAEPCCEYALGETHMGLSRRTKVAPAIADVNPLSAGASSCSIEAHLQWAAATEQAAEE